MNVINTYSNKRFTLNGVQYLKNYISKVTGNRIAVYNCYDNKDTLIEADLYSNFVINGVTYGSVSATQAALLDVLYSRGTLGSDVTELDQNNIHIVKEVSITSADTETDILAKINALTLYNVDEFSTVYFECTDGADRRIVYSMVGLGKGSYGISGTQLTAENLIKIYEYVPGTVQNNKQVFKSFIITGSSPVPLTSTELATLMNGFTTTFTETDVPFVTVLAVGVSPAIEHLYAFKNGKGVYGVGGTPVTAGMLKFIRTLNAPVDDENTSGNTVTFTLGTVSNYITALNSVARDLTDNTLVYIVNYTTSGVAYSKYFIGEDYGMYGGTNTLQFTDAMWQDVVTSETPTPAGFRVTYAKAYENGKLKSTDLVGATEVVQINSDAIFGAKKPPFTLDNVLGEIHDVSLVYGRDYTVIFK